MKPNLDPLARLFRSAAQAPAREMETASARLEARVVSGWHEFAGGEGADAWLAWLRRATVAACALAVVALIWSYSSTSQERGDELVVADAAMRVGVDP